MREHIQIYHILLSGCTLLHCVNIYQNSLSRYLVIKCKPFIFFAVPLRILTIRYLPKVKMHAFLCHLCLLVENKLPPPENVRIDAVNDIYVLKWDYASENMTFQAQWLQ